MTKETTKEKTHGQKQKWCVEIMNEYGPGHVFEEVTARIREKLCVDENSARSYYRHIFKAKRDQLNPGWEMSKPTRKTRSAPVKSEIDVSGVDMNPTSEKRGTPERLQTIKEVAAKMKNRKSLENATKKIEELAAAGAQHGYAETESPTTADA